MNNKDFYIAGIGASAGGFNAIKTFFSSFSETPNIAFILIQHLSADFKTLTSDWLSKYTSFKIKTVEDDLEVIPGHVYIMPEAKTLTIKGKKLILAQRKKQDIINFSIDTFFDSLGKEVKEKAIGVILSGTGTDGARGIITIKENGGTVFVQQPDSAEFDGMPRVAISIDDPDAVLPPEKLAKKITEYIKNPAVISEQVYNEANSTDKEIIQNIIEHVSDYSHVNFRGYKLNTIIRRIEKRIKLNHLNSIADYHLLTKKNPKEIEILYNDLLIGVTQFFRDKEAFKALESKVIPALFKGKKSFETVRIWVMGCSTGEEPYSVAILCDEYVKKNNLSLSFKIFATDIDHKSIEVASIGRFRNNIESEVNEERLKNYFHKIGDFYDVKRELRKKIIFARHNLISDPPFIRLDLISCRNLFIYLKPELQAKLLNSFSFALKPNAFLFLGLSESSVSLNHLFETVDERSKIFRNKNIGGKNPLSAILNTYQSASDVLAYEHKENGKKGIHQPSEERFEDLLLKRFAPACIFINKEDEVIYSYGNLDPYLSLPKKRMSLNIYSMARDEIATIFRNGLRKARSGESILFKDISFKNETYNFAVNIRFESAGNKDDKLVLVEFLEPNTVPKSISTTTEVRRDALSSKEVEELEQELMITKKELQFAIDELETINEELQASNEEMHSSNEELQSTNEEMQSSNEELHTVNGELQMKIDEVSSLHDDISNLINHSEIAIVFLDDELRIRMFTPAAKANFNFLETDIGRPFSHLSHNFCYYNFSEDVKKVLEQHEPIEMEVDNKDGHFFIVRILPYKTEENELKGIVFTFVDISKLKKTTNELKKRTSELEISEQDWKSLVNNTPDMISRYDEDMRYLSVNEPMAKHLGMPASEIIGKLNKELPFPNKKEEVKKWLDYVSLTLDKGEISHTFFDYFDNDQKKHSYTSFVPEFYPNEKRVKSVLVINRDVTSMVNYEKLIENQNKQLKKINIDLDNFIYTASHDLRSPITNVEGLTQILKKKLANKVDASENKILDMIDKSITKFKATISDLTEVTKVQKNINNELEVVSFPEVMDDLKEELQSLIAQNEAHLDINFTVDTIAYSQYSLRSILYNLVSNAIKYKSPERPAEIFIETTREQGRVVLLVKDNGLGLSKFQQSKIFEMFKRLHTHVEGTGIGLYIVKRIIENNGGRIEIESAPGKGSVFKVYF